ncbi:efflux RND transporter periplasmic adaptor subunit [candidate division BRC1 bacterium HGW-BRC1-1]|jgi:HlyD family secretion protein|nr:MAG: efflux RND transporter periplasmic adaptor subunit [candidate division BRC1 bacterium HGW-BRC1-1]
MNDAIQDKNRVYENCPTAEEIKSTLEAGTRRRGWPVRIVAVTLLLAAAAAATVALKLGSSGAGSAYDTLQSERGDLTITVSATGTLQATTTVEVGAEVSGRILAVNVDANDRVSTGQILAVIDEEELRAAVDKESAQVAAAEAAIKLSQVTAHETQASFERVSLLKVKKVVSQEDLDTATAANDRAVANLAAATANATLATATLKSATSRLAKATIRSPIDGSVLSRLVEPGQTVTAGFQTPLMFKLAQDLKHMRLNVDVDEADVGRVREGMEASFTVEAYPERKFVSRVLSLHNEPTDSSNVVTYQAVLSVDNEDGLLRPGMTCTATIISETRRDALMVPNAALRFTPPSKQLKRGEKAVGQQETVPLRKVWMLTNDEPVAVELQTGSSDGNMTEILKGQLEPGTPLLVDMKEEA